jgi:hypothetical protein
MKVYGCADFVFEIGDEPCSYASPLCVADIGVDMILGYDFMRLLLIWEGVCWNYIVKVKGDPETKRALMGGENAR